MAYRKKARHRIEKKAGGGYTFYLKWKKGTVAVLFCGTICLLGVFFATFGSNRDENALGLCMDYFLENFWYEDVVKEELLRYVLLHRGLLFFLGAANGANLLRNHIRYGMVGIVLFFLSYGWGVLIAREHIRGIMFLLGMITPQWYFYGAGIFFSEKMRNAFMGGEMPEMWKYSVFYALLFGIGVLTEITINPIWMKFLIELI